MADQAEFEVYQRDDERWAWRLVHENGNVLATDGGQGYENPDDAYRIGRRVVTGDYRVRDERAGSLSWVLMRRSEDLHPEVGEEDGEEEGGAEVLSGGSPAAPEDGTDG